MTKLWILLPVLMGIAIVIQSGLNDKIQKYHGLLYAIVLNNLVFLGITSTLLTIHFLGNVQSKVLDFKKFTEFDYWYLAPGLLAVFIVGGSALSFQKLGASKTMILMVVAQVVGGVVWDFYMKDINVSSTKVIAIFLAIASAVLVAK